MAKAKKNDVDFEKLYEEFKNKVVSTDVLKNDAILNRQVEDFGRMAKMNDELWRLIEEKGYSYIDEKTGRIVINPAVGTFDKNVSVMQKQAALIEEKTKGITIADSKKTW